MSVNNVLSPVRSQNVSAKVLSTSRQGMSKADRDSEEIELNRSTDEAALQLASISLNNTLFSGLCWNFAPGHILAEVKKSILSEALRETSSDVVLFQEHEWAIGNLQARVAEAGFPALDGFQVFGINAPNNKHASIVVRNEHRTELLSMWDRHLEIYYLRNRSVAVTVTFKKPDYVKVAQPDVAAIFISVHLPYVGINAVVRRTNAEYILNRGMELSIRHNLPIVIGGDFNTDVQRVQIPHRMILPSDLYTRDGHVDGVFFYSPPTSPVKLEHILAKFYSFKEDASPEFDETCERTRAQVDELYSQGGNHKPIRFVYGFHTIPAL